MAAKLLSQKLAEKQRAIRVIYVSTYIPRECGIATFTKDLTTAINVLNPSDLAEIVAINDPATNYQYPWEVKYRIKQEDPRSYMAAADYINQSSCEVVNIQHEFGIFGGTDGEYILPFLDCINKNIIVTFHTVLSKPKPNVLKIVKKIAHKSKAIVVMIDEAAKRLVKEYGIPKSKIIVIHHGVPDIAFSPSTPHKSKLKLTGKIVVSTFGLLSSGKGIEYAIKAMAEVAKKSKEVIYLIIGATHPMVLKKEKERYREELKSLVKKLNLSQNIKFINSYLSIDELIEYLQATDIYVTPYLNPAQISSGTLAYAVGAGKPCISTPYIYAVETLNKVRGKIVPFKDDKAIAKEIISLINNKDKRVQIAKKAYLYGRNMTWHNVALKYLDLFSVIAKK